MKNLEREVSLPPTLKHTEKIREVTSFKSPASLITEFREKRERGYIYFRNYEICCIILYYVLYAFTSFYYGI